MRNLLGLLLVVVFASGCVRVQTKLVDRERVDQEIAGVEPTAPKTRKVVEIRVAGKEEVSRQAVIVSSETRIRETVEATPLLTPGVLPESRLLQGATPLAARDVPAPRTYTVEKDDTLQKISKKLYGSYGKWTKIYDANKEVIKDPNFLKPGTVLNIPAVE